MDKEPPVAADICPFPFRRPRATEPSHQLLHFREADGPTRVRLPSGEDAWLVTRYDQVRAVLRDPRLSLAAPAAPGGPRFVPFTRLCRSLLSLDPPEHTAVRRLMAASFTPRRVQALRRNVQEVSGRLLDAMQEGGHAGDLASEYADPLSVQSMALVLGTSPAALDEVRSSFHRLIEFQDQSDADIEEAWQHMSGGILRILAGKKGDPGEDTLTDIATLSVRDEHVTQDHVLGVVVTMLGAGIGTPVIQICHAVVTLLEHPEQLALLKERPELLGAAVDEILRFNAPTEVDHLRVATEDMRVGDTEIPKGSLILPSIAAADRDPKRFPHPDRFDIERTSNGHVAFGTGTHTCAGSPLARLQLEIGLRDVFGRFPRLRLREPAARLQLKSGTSHSLALKELPVEW